MFDNYIVPPQPKRNIYFGSRPEPQLSLPLVHLWVPDRGSAQRAGGWSVQCRLVDNLGPGRGTAVLVNSHILPFPA
eukprot:759301-Hanusia_phi.AAC.1